MVGNSTRVTNGKILTGFEVKMTGEIPSNDRIVLHCFRESIGVCRCMQVSATICGLSVGICRCLWCLQVSVGVCECLCVFVIICGVSLGVCVVCAGMCRCLQVSISVCEAFAGVCGCLLMSVGVYECL